MIGTKKPLTMATEAITQRSFARRKGIYMREMFTSPPMHSIEGIELPLGSVVHYLPEEDKDHAPDESWWLIRGQAKECQIWIEHMTEFTLYHGKARRLPGDPNNWARKWHMKQPRLKRVINRKTALAMPTNLLVVNHALARNWYDYHNNRFLGYQIAKNTRDNALIEIARAVEEIDRAHFIPVKMPSRLYELTKVKKAASEGDALQVESVKRFGSVEGLFFLEIWRFIADPASSVLSKIGKDYWSRVNLILTCNGSWFMVNLADLASWVKTESNPEGKWDPEKAQRIFLSNMVQLVENALVAEKKQNDELSSDDLTQSSLGDAPSTVKESSSTGLGTILSNKVNPNQDLVLQEPQEDGVSETTPGISPLLTKGRGEKQKSKDLSKKSSTDSRKGSSEVKAVPEAASIVVVKTLTDEEIDSNLEALEKVDAIVDEPDYQPNNPNQNPLEEGILARARKLARDGLISAAALKQSEKLAVAYKQIKNPFGDGLAYEASRITPEERKVEAKSIPTRSKRVFDESLKVSSIEDVTTKYVRESYKKDVVNVLLSTQRSGVAITDIEVDTVENMSGSQLVVLARTTALTGRSTTLPIILPNFEKDGTYMSGGTRYRMRTQRVDAPIRLVRPGLVYLTSYYGKVSVSRSDKVVHDYDRWLCNKIAALEIDGSPLIKGSEHGNVFDQSLHMPKTFSILSRRFKSLQLANYLLMFDRKEIDRTFPERERLALKEHQEWVICGIDSANKPVMMNGEGEVFVNKVNQGRIEDIFGIDTSEAPHPAVMIRIRGNSLPLGVVLASYIGLTNLISHLGNKVRRVQSGNRMHLEPYETPIRFADESLIVDTRDAKTTLLMMGFKHYAKQIRQLSVYGFDKAHSYQFLFDSSNRVSANSVELELLDEQFVDPMTERVLIDMKEPTTWQGLLWRSLELILTDYSPEEMDGKMMNFKLHERVNGMLYNELVKSIRRYKMDSRIGKAGVDMKPTAVWQKIATDAAISPVNDCNPVADLRAQEGVTYIGHGGRSKRSMVARNRKYHANDTGVISEANVDSGDTGISIYFSANPNVLNTSGVSEPGSADSTGISSMVSTSALLGPCLDIDDQMVTL